MGSGAIAPPTGPIPNAVDIIDAGCQRHDIPFHSTRYPIIAGLRLQYYYVGDPSGGAGTVGVGMFTGAPNWIIPPVICRAISPNQMP